MWCANSETVGKADTGNAFVAMRWHELFDKFTPDTFHPKLFSLPSLVSEARTIAELHKDHEAWGKHLALVQLELRDRLDRGFERTLCSPRHAGMLAGLSKNDRPAEVADVGRVLELEGFQDQLENAVRNRFANLDFTKVADRKSEGDTLLTTLATYAFRKGCNSEDCGGIAEVISLSSDDVRSWIFSAVPEGESEWDCIIAVEADPDLVAPIRSVTENAGIKRASPKISGLPDGENLIFFQRRENGLRPSDAVEKLKHRVRSGLNLLALYRQERAPRLLPGGWRLDRSGATRIETRSPSLQNLHSRADAKGLADRAADALARRNGEAALRAALDLHNLALSMNDHRLRLVNLWSALECLASIVEGDSIISRVDRLVVPLLTWRKIDKVVRYLAISIHFWLKENPEIDRARLPFGLGHNESVAPDRILTLLAEPKDSAGIRSLLALVSGHPLLRYRINEGWKLFHDPKTLRSNLNRSGESLRWHLWRIYRARNLLVHQGDEPPCIPQLANHLQQYFSSTLSRILHGMTFGEQWNSRDSWCYWRSQSEHVIRSLANAPKDLLVDDMFPEEVATPGVSVWPPD